DTRDVEGENSRVVLQHGGADEFSAAAGELIVGVAADVFHFPADRRFLRRGSQFTEESQARRKADLPGPVRRAPFVARSGSAELQVEMAKIVLPLDAVPTGVNRTKEVEMLAANEEDAGPFRSEQPLVAIGGEEVDFRLAHIDRKDTQSLDRVEKEE